MQQWQTGHKFKNRPYEILQELGEGGFGITYIAKNLSLDVPVVIKTPNSKLQRDGNYSKYLANFIKEAKQLAKLGMNPHPHIVRVFDFFEEDNFPCIVMDYIRGDSLYNIVQTNGALREEQALKYIRQIGSALSVCHQQGIIHRDAHPNNILIHADSGKAILIDFGISGSTQSSYSNHAGNRAFAPWEQLISFGQQSSKTPQVDIYTLAASFYYLITGHPPTLSLARKFNDDELIEPRQYNLHISNCINGAIIKGLEIEINQRPKTVDAWLNIFKTSEPKPKLRHEYFQIPVETQKNKFSEPLIRKKKQHNAKIKSEESEKLFKIAGWFSFAAYFSLELFFSNKFLTLKDDFHSGWLFFISLLGIFWMLLTSMWIPLYPQKAQKTFNVKKYSKTKRGWVLFAILAFIAYSLFRKAKFKIILLTLPYVAYLLLFFPYNLASLFIKIKDNQSIYKPLSNLSDRETYVSFSDRLSLLAMSFLGLSIGFVFTIFFSI